MGFLAADKKSLAQNIDVIYNDFMSFTAKAILSNEVIRLAIKQAWLDSKPNITGGHEEGGFVVRNEDSSLSVMRWNVGSQNTIRVPAHPNCKINNLDIIASFHTHPNTGANYLQEPSETDKRAVRNDSNLKGEDYIGEFVISKTIIYLITPNGQVREIDDTQSVFYE